MKYMKLGSKPDSFQAEGNNNRSIATELATDIIVKVGEVKFYLHKFPLLSKSSRLQKLVAANNEENNDEIDISDIPGGPIAFEICAKFCYGMTVTLNAYNVVASRCAAEYLEMHEIIDRGNLIYKIDVFLNSSIFRSWKDSIIVLQTTKSFLPWSEDLKIVNHCIDSIASKVSIDPSDVEWSYTYNQKKLHFENGVRKLNSVPEDWWVEDLCELDMDSYKRVLMAIKSKGRAPAHVIGEALKAYTYKNNEVIMRDRTLLGTIVWLLPIEKNVVSCNFLLNLLKAAILVDCGENCKKELVKRIGRQLNEASVCDLLIPREERDGPVFDVDIVLNIIEEFLMMESGSGETSPTICEIQESVRSPAFVSTSSKLAVANLIDGYLAEISKDPNLQISKFVEVAEMVSPSSRPVHDGLYQAIDKYLKVHTDLSKSEKKKICSLIDCKKLTPDACMHAVQNERLPLRLVVQVLFFEQLRASGAPETQGGAHVPSLLPQENTTSNSSSRSAATTTNTGDESWDGVPTTGDLSSLKSMNLAGNGKPKGLMPKKLLSKLWSKKGQGENSSSDTSTSESPGGSINPEESKSTPSRNNRHSVS